MTDTEQLRRIAVRAGIMGSHGTQVPMHKLEAFASLLLDEENEACAQVCDDSYETTTPGQGLPEDWLLTLSEQIRARRKA